MLDTPVTNKLPYILEFTWIFFLLWRLDNAIKNKHKLLIIATIQLLMWKEF